MVVQTVNNHAIKKYEEFTGALETVRIALAEADAVIKEMSDVRVSRVHWKVPAKAELIAARKKVSDLLDVLRGKAKEYEKQLIANGWRV